MNQERTRTSTAYFADRLATSDCESILSKGKGPVYTFAGTKMWFKLPTHHATVNDMVNLKTPVNDESFKLPLMKDVEKFVAKRKRSFALLQSGGGDDDDDDRERLERGTRRKQKQKEKQNHDQGSSSPPPSGSESDDDNHDHRQKRKGKKSTHPRLNHDPLPQPPVASRPNTGHHHGDENENENRDDSQGSQNHYHSPTSPSSDVALSPLTDPKEAGPRMCTFCDGDPQPANLVTSCCHVSLCCSDCFALIEESEPRCSQCGNVVENCEDTSC